MRWFFELVSSKTQYDFLGFMFVVTFIYTFLELEKVQVGYVSVACL